MSGRPSVGAAGRIVLEKFQVEVRVHRVGRSRLAPGEREVQVLAHVDQPLGRRRVDLRHVHLLQGLEGGVVELEFLRRSLELEAGHGVHRGEVDVLIGASAPGPRAARRRARRPSASSSIVASGSMISSPLSTMAS